MLKKEKILSIMKYVKLLRIKHWCKNFLVFLPLFFSGRMLEIEILGKTLIGWCCFSLTASIIYVINDLKDVEKDRCHPIKRLRPIASGEITILQAKIVVAVLALAICSISAFYWRNTPPYGNIGPFRLYSNQSSV